MCYLSQKHMVLRVTYTDYSKTTYKIVRKEWRKEEWRKINSGVQQGSVPGPLSFLIYINDLPDCITSICKTFADNTSLFSKVQDINKSVNELNCDLGKVGD